MGLRLEKKGVFDKSNEFHMRVIIEKTGCEKLFSEGPEIEPWKAAGITEYSSENFSLTLT